MWRSELGLVFGRRRNKALLALLAMVPVVVAFALWLSGRGPVAGEGPPFLAQVSHNGVFAALAGLAMVLPFLLPLSISVVAGDSIAGEASFGTLRYLLARPVGRSRLLAAKFGAVVVFCMAAALAVGVAGLFAGAVFFPVGRVVTLSGTSLSLAAGIGRTLATVSVVGASMVGLAAVGTFASTLTEAPVGAMAATAATYVVSQVLDTIPQLRSIHPVLFTDKWFSFQGLLRDPVTLGGIERDLVLQVAWTAVFLVAAWARMTTRDVLA